MRWAPINASSWRLANQYGYMVVRYTILQKKKVPKEIIKTNLVPDALKPSPIDEWKKFADDKYVAIAAECIFGKGDDDIPTNGNPHIAYKKYREEIHRFSFAIYAADQSIKTAKLSGLYIADKTAQEDEKYLYRVFINCPDTIITDTASAFTGLSEFQPLPKPLELKAEWSDKEVTLSWNIKYLNHIYNSYFIEKSDDKGKTYYRLSENATVQVADKKVSPGYMYKTDTLDNNKDVVYYRVRGISAFGEISPPSDSVFGTGLLPIKNAPVILATDIIENKKVKLLWDYPEDMNAYITGFKIYHSPKPNGRKKLIYFGDNPYQRSFVDTAADFTNYYLISVYNNETEKLSPITTYAERIDSFPPAPPVAASGIIDTNGKVTITWDENTDKDLKGYRVYWSNHPKFEFMLASPDIIIDTVFTDTINLKTLTKNIYYKLKAVDVRDNLSPFSEMLTISRPDIVPPVSPVIKNITDNKGFPELQWVNSSSSDVAKHHIYRKIEGESDSLYKLIATIQKTNDIRSTYYDKTGEKGKAYIYFVSAEDEAGLLSNPSNTGYFKIESGITEKVKIKKKQFIDYIELTWTVTSEKEIERILVYRSTNDDPLKLYDNTTGPDYKDRKITPETEYNYAIKVVFTDGSSSVLSNKVKARL